MGVQEDLLREVRKNNDKVDLTNRLLVELLKETRRQKSQV